MRQGHRQGLSIAPVDFMAAMMMVENEVEEQGSDDHSIPELMPSLQSGGNVSKGDMTLEEKDLEEREGSNQVEEAVSVSLQEGEINLDYECYTQDYSINYYCEQLSREMAVAPGHCEGDTVASTVSELSTLEVYCVEGLNALQLEAHTWEIPFRELDDPPDVEEIEAASLDGASEIEHVD